jgi:hypothetical protein
MAGSRRAAAISRDLALTRTGSVIGIIRQRALSGSKVKAVAPEARRCGQSPHQQMQNGQTIRRATTVDRKLLDLNWHKSTMDRILSLIGESRRNCVSERMGRARRRQEFAALEEEEAAPVF